MLMVWYRLRANAAAVKIGDESASQFSRKFKCFFGNTPADEVAKMWALGNYR
jgi:hypothetical protein